MMKNKQTMWICVGGPGSGKTTWSKKLVENDANIVRVCPDDNRRAIGGDSNNQAVSYPAFCMAKDQVRNALAIGKDVVFDATNMHRKARKDFIKLAREHGAQAIAVVFECNKETLLIRNAKRGAEGGRNVSEEIINMMLGNYQRPDETEFDKVTFIKQ